MYYKEVQIKADVDKVVTVGDMNLCYTVHVILPRWLKEQRYHMIHTIRRILWGKQNDDTCGMLDYQLKKKGFAIQDIEIARMNAYDEFWRRVGQFYEDKAIEKNGDVYEGVPFADDRLAAKENPILALTKKKKRSGGKNGISKTAQKS